MDARQSIRGASSIVDGMRFAFAMWLTDEKEANQYVWRKVLNLINSGGAGGHGEK